MLPVTDRVIILVDMDCFYCQVEEQLDANLLGKPIAVVQYNAWKGGGIIAVNYPARDRGVTRHMRGDEAKQKCPEIELVRVPQVRGKADLTKYREAGKRVAAVLQTFTALLERASVDEAYLDVTASVNDRIAGGDGHSHLDDLTVDKMANSFVVGSETKDFLENVKANPDLMERELKLAVGGLIAEEIRLEVYKQTGYRCSAGIAHNKILAKLVCGLHKPNKQTILPQRGVAELFATLPVRKIQSLGGKFGTTLVDVLGITYVGELRDFTETDLRQKFDAKMASWLYNIARGINLDPVTSKLVAKSVACSKNFPGKNALFKLDNVKHWLDELACDLSERLQRDFEENNRKAKQIVVSFMQELNKQDVTSSRTNPLSSYDAKRIAQIALEVINKYCMKSDGSYHVKHLGLSAGNFEDVKNVRAITSFFKVQSTSMDSTPVEEIIEGSNHVDEMEVDEKINDRLSIYSATTEEMLDEDVDSYVFLDDSRRIKEQTSTNNNLLVVAGCSSENTSKIEEPKASSFFQSYFRSNPTQRKTIINEGNILSDEEIIEQQSSNPLVSDMETCSECGKNVPKNDFTSHLDYHYALKLARSESGSKVEQIDKSKMRSAGGGKRKKNGESSSPPPSNTCLLMFLKKDNVGDELVLADGEENGCFEICTECNKKVQVDEIVSHMDYHAAKKLHLEINRSSKERSSPPPPSTVQQQSRDKSKSNRNKKNIGKINSISSYFRPL